MEKFIFVKIVYDNEQIPADEIKGYLSRIRNINRSIDLQHFNTSHYTREQADYVCYTINDNPI